MSIQSLAVISGEWVEQTDVQGLQPMSRVRRVDGNQDPTLVTQVKEVQSAMRAMAIEHEQPPVSFSLV
jgi:hypothetical protein